MKKNLLYFYGICCVFLVCPLFSFAFGWPVPIAKTTEISVFFAQSLAETFSCGITFVEKEGVAVAADSGKALIALSEAPSPQWFNSTLGNALVIAHEDDLITVYGNLREKPLIYDYVSYSAGQSVGATGESAWNNEKRGLVFAVADTKNQTAFNPFMLLSKLEENPVPQLRGIILINRNGRRYNLTTTRAIPADIYSVYREKNPSETVPYVVNVLINGARAGEVVNFNMIKSTGSVIELTGAGGHSFAFSRVYPDERLQLLAIAELNRGKTTLSLSLANNLEQERTVSYSLEIY